MGNVFVSYASRDEALAKAFVKEILLLALSIPEDAVIRGVATEQGSISGQQSIADITKNVGDDALTIFLLSQHYYNNPACLCEMGAAWARSARVFFLLIPPLAHGDVTAVVADRHIDTITEACAYKNLRTITETRLGYKTRTVKFQDQVQKFLDFLPTLPSGQGHPEYVSYDTYKELEEDLKDYKKEHQRYAAIIKNQKGKIKRLVALQGTAADKMPAAAEGSQE
ncbi:MAG: toll/interleukin-1 receptor domain-containing protein [Solidesulfovibrio sp.]